MAITAFVFGDFNVITVCRRFNRLNELRIRQRLAVNRMALTRIATKDNLLQHGISTHMRPYGADRNCGRRLQWIRVSARADCRKRDRSDPVFPCQSQRVRVTSSEQFALATSPASPNRSHGMNDPSCLQTKTRCDLCFPSAAAAKLTAYCQQLRARRIVNRTIHTAAAEQGGIRRVDDRFGIESRDVAANDPNDLSCHGLISIGVPWNTRRDRNGGANCERNDETPKWKIHIGVPRCKSLRTSYGLSRLPLD